MLVDDEPQLVDLVKMRLEANDYDVAVAFNGEEGLKKAQEETPDLVLLDVTMPQMDGYTVASKLRQLEQTKSIPIIMFTAKSAPDDVARSHQLGAVDYIVKPFDQLVLLEKVKKHLPKRKSR